MMDRRQMIGLIAGLGSLGLFALTRTKHGQQISPSDMLYHLRRDVGKKPRQVPSLHQLRIDRSDFDQILSRVQPQSSKPRPNVGMAIHAVRLWYSVPSFLASSIPTPSPFQKQTAIWWFQPSELLAFLLDGRVFARAYPESPPLLEETIFGVKVRGSPAYVFVPENVWPDYQAHVDKLASLLGEIRIPSNTPIVPSNASQIHTVTDLVTDSLARFEIDQECEFTIKSYLYYLPLDYSWSNRFGQKYSIRGLMDRLVQQPLGIGACLGIHQLHTAALALAIHDSEPFLRSSAERQIVDMLSLVSRRLEHFQLPDGAWSNIWDHAPGYEALVANEQNSMVNIRCTGHHLEWIAIAPRELRPKNATIQRAVEYLLDDLHSYSNETICRHYSVMTHAVRGLAVIGGFDKTDGRANQSAAGVS